MYKICKILLPALIVCFNGFAQNTVTLNIDYRTKKLPYGLEEKVPASKPVVSLALSGGGSRGLAQIGVLKALTENKIPFEVVVGTSMGSIVGGLYSAGFTPDQLDSIVSKTDWGFLLALDRETNRRDLFIDQKISEDRAIFALRLDGLNPIFPTAINNGIKLSNYLNLLTLQAPIHIKNNFDELLTKYRAVSSNLITGNAEVLGKGSLSRSMRASSSVSFLLSPVRIDSLLLVDGGLVANIPVKIAKELGSDYVIAVNATSSLAEENNLIYPWIVADQLVSIPMKLLNEYQLSYANHVIELPLPDRSANDFVNLGKSVDDGYYYTLPHIKEIRRNLDSLFETRTNRKEFFVKNISFRGEANDFEIPYQIKYSKKDSVSSNEIIKDMAEVFDSGDLKNISAEIDMTGNYSQVKFIRVYNPLIKKINITGVSLYDKKSAYSVFSNLENKPYNAKTILKDAFSLINLYRTDGYCFADIDTIYFTENSNALNIRINEGKISGILIEGNNFTNPTIIMREIAKADSGYYKAADIQESFKNIRSTNLFEDIYIYTKKVEGKNYLLVKVIEKTSSLMRFGFRFDNENSLQVSVDLRDENLFGTGTEFGSILLIGSRNRSYILEQKANRIFNTYMTYKINAFYKLNDINTYKNDEQTSPQYFSRSKEGDYRQAFYGFSLAVGTQVGRFGNMMVKGTYERDEVKNVNTGEINPYKTTIVSLKGILTIDTQDKYPYPTKGMYFSGSYETAQSILGGEVGFTNFGFDYKNYISVYQSHTIIPHIMMGFADKTLPLSQQYSLGGQNMFYGMRDNEYRGRQIFLTSLEYRYKIPFFKLFDTYFLARYDLGSAWEVQDQIRFKDLKHGIGATLSFNTPVGPADFSVGRSFEFRKSLDGGIVYGPVRFYFSIGFYY